MKINRITIEQSLYLLAFALALGVRLLRLGVAPLSDFEANWALQAFQVAHGERAALGPQPGYIMLTGLTFFLFGSSNFLARLWPALAGSLLIGLPLCFRRQLGAKAALVMAFGLALDPGLTALSRLAGGAMFAAGFGLLALGLAYARRPLWAGICAGLALLGGPAVLQGAVGLGLTWGAWKSTERLRGKITPQETEPALPLAMKDVRVGILAGGGVMLLAGALFGAFPQGLNALAALIPAYLQGWTAAAGAPISSLVAALAVYEPLVILWGVVAAARKELFARRLGLWAAIALLLALLYPARQTGDMVWTLVALWGAAALELAAHWKVEEGERLPASGQAALIVVLLALAWFNLAALTRSATDVQTFRLRWAVIGGTLLLAAVTTLLVALGWSKTAAARGLAWGLSAALGLYSLAALMGATQLRPNGERELWYPTPTITVQEANLFLRTLNDLALWRNGQRETLDIAAVSPTASLRWALRGWRTARFVMDLQAVGAPEVVITPGDQTELKMGMAYRGQDFAWRVSPGWTGGLPPDWERWLTFREAPLQKESLILWARSDLFPGGELAPAQPATPLEEEPAVPGQ